MTRQIRTNKLGWLSIGAWSALIASHAAASDIQLINSSPSNVEFAIYQGVDRVARIGVNSGDTAQVPTTQEYVVTASTLMGEFELSSNPVSFSGASQDVTAQVLNENGFFDFRLVERPSISSSAIILENTWSSPVQFKLTRPNSPFQIVTVVNEHDCFSFDPPAQAYSVFAVVNGVTSPTVSIMDPNAKITALPNNGNDGVTLVVN